MRRIMFFVAMVLASVAGTSRADDRDLGGEGFLFSIEHEFRVPEAAKYELRVFTSPEAYAKWSFADDGWWYVDGNQNSASKLLGQQFSAGMPLKVSLAGEVQNVPTAASMPFDFAGYDMYLSIVPDDNGMIASQAYVAFYGSAAGSVPEPSALLLAGVGLASMVGGRSRRV